MQQRKHGEWELQRQHYLAEREQIIHAGITAHADYYNRGNNRQRPRDEPAQPGLNAPVHKAFHDHLPGQRAGDGAALTAS